MKSLTGTPNERTRPTSPAGQWQATRIGDITGAAPTANPTITGTVATGQMLTATVGFSDADGDTEGTHTYQWYRADNALGTIGRVTITGATSLSYVVTAADQGKYLVFEVVPKATTGAAGTLVGAATSKVTTIAVPGTAPNITGAVTISGTYAVGQTLTGTYSYQDAENDPEDTTASGTTYKWWISNASTGAPEVIPGATSRTFTLRPQDAGDSRTVWFEVSKLKSTTGTPNERLPSPANQWQGSRNGVITGAAPTINGALSISGTFAVGQTLEGIYPYHDDNGDLEDRTASGTTYKWWISNIATGAPEVISGAIGRTFMLRPQDAGSNRTIWFEVSKLKSATGTPNERLPNPVNQWQVARTGLILGTAPTAAPTISGTVRAGETLTANAGYLDTENDPEGGTTYQWCEHEPGNATPVSCSAPGASKTLFLSPSHVGRQISVRVIPRSSSGNPDTGIEATSSRTVTVAQALDLPVATGPTITGQLMWGATLTAGMTYSNAGTAAPGPGTHVYQWYRSANASGEGKQAIPGATSQTYTLQRTTDEGRYFAVEITPRSSLGASGAMVTAMTAKETPYRRTEAFEIPEKQPGQVSISISNRSGNAPSDLQVHIRRSYAGAYLGRVDMTLVAPSGTTYALGQGPLEGEYWIKSVDVSSEPANGEWKLLLGPTPASMTEYDLFTLVFTP